MTFYARFSFYSILASLYYKFTTIKSCNLNVITISVEPSICTIPSLNTIIPYSYIKFNVPRFLADTRDLYKH